MAGSLSLSAHEFKVPTCPYFVYARGENLCSLSLSIILHTGNWFQEETIQKRQSHF